ncbi:hypothetical protein SUGI_1131850 [Cryptomeria japonica]|uniref:uncharacterized protein LOC131066082 n=1 Tax=Cryptomeria japonica TaxID=3369 RepID=UPI002414ADCA|nr:uncharacterized protein LOC131066082 [Cryptomeria japonica]GLJ53118.1 hypothetical protein SUGI_1131850 [Cryptomeria japonica]
MNHLRSKSLQYIANTSVRRRICSPPWQKYAYSTAAQEMEIDQRKLPTDFDPATFNPTQHRAPPTERVFRLVDEVSSLTLLEVSELSGILMKRLGVTELPTMAVMQPGTAAAAAAAAAIAGGAAKPAEEGAAKAAKTAFDLRLDGFDAASKIKVIKEVRAITDLGLKEAKELVEKAPAVLKKGLSKEEGEQMIEKLKAAGAKVTLE